VLVGDHGYRAAFNTCLFVLCALALVTFVSSGAAASAAGRRARLRSGDGGFGPAARPGRTDGHERNPNVRVDA
jgi:hypothetical protein